MEKYHRWQNINLTTAPPRCNKNEMTTEHDCIDNSDRLHFHINCKLIIKEEKNTSTHAKKTDSLT